MNLRTFRIGGVHPEENKITAEMGANVKQQQIIRIL